MPAIWPDTLPYEFMQDGYREQPRMANNEFPSDTGPPIERPKGTIRMRDISASIFVTPKQLETFEQFVDQECGQAALAFYIPHPRKQEQIKVKFKGRPPYEVTPFGPHYWRLNFIIMQIGG